MTREEMDSLRKQLEMESDAAFGRIYAGQAEFDKTHRANMLEFYDGLKRLEALIEDSTGGRRSTRVGGLW